MGPRYRFSIGTGYTGEKRVENLGRIWVGNLKKHIILHECGREKSDLRSDSLNLHHFVNRLILDGSRRPDMR